MFIESVLRGSHCYETRNTDTKNNGKITQIRVMQTELKGGRDLNRIVCFSKAHVRIRILIVSASTHAPGSGDGGGNHVYH